MFRKCSNLIALLVVGLMQTACSSSSGQARRVLGIPWWVWLLIVVALVVWWWLSQSKKEAAPPIKHEAAAPSQVVDTPEGVARRAPSIPDDLKRIEGIGPKISSLLQEAGIMTFAQLADTDVDRLKQVIAEAGLSALADPTTWPEQARLAAAGQWDALETLQDELKGGRRA